MDIKRDEDFLLGWIGDANPEALLADGYNGAIIGICERYGMPPVAAYDKEECINILVSNNEMTYEEALDYFNFNVIGTYMGEGTPVFITLYLTPNNEESF